MSCVISQRSSPCLAYRKSGRAFSTEERRSPHLQSLRRSRSPLLLLLLFLFLTVFTKFNRIRTRNKSSQTPPGPILNSGNYLQLTETQINAHKLLPSSWPAIFGWEIAIHICPWSLQTGSWRKGIDPLIHKQTEYSWLPATDRNEWHYIESSIDPQKVLKGREGKNAVLLIVVF